MERSEPITERSGGESTRTPRDLRRQRHGRFITAATANEGDRAVTLRQRLGADVQRIYEQINDLLDSEDAIIILADGQRAITHGRGFGLSACHHELLAVEVERAIRVVTRAHAVDVGALATKSEDSRQAA